MCFLSNILSPALKGHYLESTYSDNCGMSERNIHCDVSVNAQVTVGYMEHHNQRMAEFCVSDS